MPTSAETFFQQIVDTYKELTKLLIKVVSKHALEHVNSGGASDPNVTISNILQTDVTAVTKIKSTSYGNNPKLLFVAGTDCKQLKKPIKISNMDCSNRCCGGKCDHSSPSCKTCKKKKTCSNNHKCNNCGTLKTQCDEYSQHTTCAICLRCNEQRFEQLVKNKPLSSPPPCPSVVYRNCWKIMLEFRNNYYGHGHDEIYQDFLNGEVTMSIGRFSFNSKSESTNFLLKIFQLIWKHVIDPTQLNHPFTIEERDQFIKKIDSI